MDLGTTTSYRRSASGLDGGRASSFAVATWTRGCKSTAFALVKADRSCLTDRRVGSSVPGMDKDRESKLPKDVSNYLARLGRKGAKARAEALSANKRREIAKKAAKARWSSKKRRNT